MGTARRQRTSSRRTSSRRGRPRVGQRHPHCAPAMDDKEIDTAKMQVQGQMAAQYLQEVMQKITEKCFAKCVTRPGAKLDDSEKVCLAKCMDRYLDAMALVSQTWFARAKATASATGEPGF